MKRILTTAAAALLSTSAFAGEVSATSAKLSVSGTSTVQAWKCEAKTVDARLQLKGDKLSAESVTQDVAGGKVRIATAALDCKNGTMNDHMREALKAKQHTAIQFTLKSVTAGDKAGTAKLNGELTLAGITKAITLPVTLSAHGTTVRAVGSYPLNMTEYGIKPPTLMFGTMKVGEVVTLQFDVAVPAAPAPATVGAL